MRNRNILLAMMALIITTLVVLSMQPGGSKHAIAQGSTQSSTTAATEEDYTAQCEALRTVPKVPATAAPEGTAAPEAEIARPSNSGGPGDALKLVGDPKAGAQVFVDKCQKCHGEEGKGGIQNPGSDDGTIPSLNPIDETLIDPDPRVFACNLDLFVEHGSVPSGPSPKETMQPWGDNSVLTSQQIADVISYIITLNGETPATAVPTAAK